MLNLANPPDPSGLGLFCEHLAADDELDEYGRYYLGEGARYALVCPDCISAFSRMKQLPTLAAVPSEKFDELESTLCDGVIGLPSYPTRPTGLRFRHQHYCCDYDIIAVYGTGGRWIGLRSHGDVVDLLQNATLCRIANGAIDYGQRVELYCLDEYIIVVNAFGQFGRAYSLIDGGIILELDRGDYHPGVSRFPIALLPDEEGHLLVHATSWNQLHITNLRTREAVNHRQVQDRLDYFHAGLSISPDATWIVSNGWHWHPKGAVRCWSLKDWLCTNSFEPEDGHSVKELCRRDYFWDGPVCWLNPDTLAVWGHGDDSLWMTPAVLFFDVASGKRVGWFPGPEVEGGDVFGVGPSPPRGRSTGVPGFITFDKYLYSVSPVKGTGVWDVSTGDRLVFDPDLRPVACMGDQFCSMHQNQVIISHLIMGAGSEDEGSNPDLCSGGESGDSADRNT